MTYLTLRLFKFTDVRTLEHTAGQQGVILQSVETLDQRRDADIIAAAHRNGHDTIATGGPYLAAWAEEEDGVEEYDIKELDTMTAKPESLLDAADAFLVRVLYHETNEVAGEAFTVCGVCHEVDGHADSCFVPAMIAWTTED